MASKRSDILVCSGDLLAGGFYQLAAVTCVVAVSEMAFPRFVYSFATCHLSLD